MAIHMRAKGGAGFCNSPGSAGGAILSGLIGLILGILFAAGVVWYLAQSSSFDLNRVLTRQVNKTAPSQKEKKPAAASGMSEKGYGFYEMLPKGRETAALTAPSSTGKPLAGSMYLQVGAFERPAEADNMRALLALNGIQASAQRTKLDDGRVVHRVRVGPFKTKGEMASMQNRLKAAGVTFVSAAEPR